MFLKRGDSIDADMDMDMDMDMTDLLSLLFIDNAAGFVTGAIWRI